MRQQRRRKSTARRRPVTLHSEPPAGAAVQPPRFLQRGKADEILTLGLPRPWFRDLYYVTLRASWWQFLLSGMAVYLAGNSIFALLYLAQPGSIANARPGSFADAFFFSVQTLSTVGYGQLTPATFYANLIVTLQSFVGLLVVALTTGLVFARFSRPTARVLFSAVAVVGPHNGIPTLSLRLANERRNQILQAEVSMHLLRDERTAEGVMIRRFYDLKLARYRTPVFALTFSVLHEIDEDSPLYDTDADALAAMNAELVVSASGIDETISARVHVRTSYLPHEILWNHRFADVFGWTEDGSRVIDYHRFHDTVPLSGARHMAEEQQ